MGNGPLYGNTVICTLAVDEWTAAPPSTILAVPNVTTTSNFILFDMAL